MDDKELIDKINNLQEELCNLELEKTRRGLKDNNEDELYVKNAYDVLKSAIEKNQWIKGTYEGSTFLYKPTKVLDIDKTFHHAPFFYFEHTFCVEIIDCENFIIDTMSKSEFVTYRGESNNISYVPVTVQYAIQTIKDCIDANKALSNALNEAIIPNTLVR